MATISQYVQPHSEADVYYLKLAYDKAVQSQDPSTQNGCVLMGRDNWTVTGINQFPIGIKNTPERWNDKATKYKLVVHAETDSIMKAVRHGCATKNATLYGCWVCCLDCARDIIQSGITELVGHYHERMNDRPDWNAGIVEAFELLKEAGVKVRLCDVFLDKEIRFAGKLIRV